MKIICDLKCPYCKNDWIVKSGGLVPTLSMGNKQRYRCNKCGHTFYNKNSYCLNKRIGEVNG
jgi:transposase-like protein